MRRVIFVNRFFFPDYSATSQILSDLAFQLASTGREAHVITSQQRYDDPVALLRAEESIKGVWVHRVATTRFGRSALLGRTLDYLSFYRSVWQCLTDLAKPGDLIVAMTDPPLLSVVAAAAARRKNAGLVNWLQDLYPEIAVQLGVPMLRGPLASGLTRLRNKSLQAAEANITVGQVMAERLGQIGISPQRIRVIPNWCDDVAVRPVSESENWLRQESDLDGKFVVGYSGNLGRVHEYDTILGAAESLREDPRIVFTMIGGGKKSTELAKAVKAKGLQRSFRFMPYQVRNLLAYSLAIADVHWLSLNPALEGLIVPSKLYGIAAAGKPIIYIGDPSGELATLVKKHRCGVVIEPGRSEELVVALLGMVRDRKLLHEMGLRARAMLDAAFTSRHAFERWSSLLNDLDMRQNRPEIS